MNDDFEQRLQTRFRADDEPMLSERFDSDVRARITRLRRVRRTLVSLGAAAAAVGVAILATPLIGMGAASLAAAPAVINDGLSALLVSPAAYVLGTLAAVTALADAFRD
jgi:heterodisulfide reductase subunit A-like polyferredoxin